MIKYTLYTEDLPTLEAILSEAELDYTMVKQVGVWNGMREASVQIIIILDDIVSPLKIMNLAKEIKAVNNQQAVLVTEEAINGILI